MEAKGTLAPSLWYLVAKNTCLNQYTISLPIYDSPLCSSTYASTSISTVTSVTIANALAPSRSTPPPLPPPPYNPHYRPMIRLHTQLQYSMSRNMLVYGVLAEEDVIIQLL